MDSHDHKHLDIQIRGFEREKKGLQESANQISERIRLIERELAKLKSQLQKKTSPDGITVSEHAMLRYLERVHKIDLECVKQDILGGAVITGKMPNGTFPVGLPTPTHRIKVRNGVVITVMGMGLD